MQQTYLILTSIVLVTTLACSSGGSTVTVDAGLDQTADLAVDGGADTGMDGPDQLVTKDLPFDPPDADAFSLPDLGDEPGCAPGEGCFLDPCTDNGDCLSGWCVGHMGESVCTQQCQSECPPGWSCQQIPGTAPDVVFVCVSDHANLCLPCATGSDCQGSAGETAPCLDYGQQGSFCGGTCSADEDCPWGFSCAQTTTVDGVPLTQCVADAGVCPCTQKSASLGLWTPCSQTTDAGTCTGKRVCTADGLTDCDAMVPALEICNGIDDNCDGDIDEATCDDANECTQDLCTGEDGCNHLPVDGECKDGDPCTVADHCEQGLCVGDAVDCDDDNPCTTDLCTVTGGCEHPPAPGSCDDDDPCTAGDICTDGQCAGTPVDCDCTKDSDCTPLEDGDSCNGTLLCDTATWPYKCVVDPASVVICPEPVGPCLASECNPENGDCSFVPAFDGQPCSDGDACTMADSCNDGLCVGGPAVNCNDGNPCTDDSCEALTGCNHSANNLPCEDGNLCTLGDQCAQGACQSGKLPDCDDNNPCTLDTCVPQKGCQHTPAALACDDGNACTANDQCVAGFCKGGPAVSCDDDNLCTDDGCNPATGCTYTMNDAPCDDGDLCTTGDHCHLGECIFSGTLPCDDGNICTDDACNANTGCTFTPNSGPCDDSNPCTMDDQCSGGWCSGPPAKCDDNNPCTDDGCDIDTGCVYLPNTDPCDDNNPCTVGENCLQSTCQGGVPLACNDDDICTDDSCNPELGCQFVDNTALCDDADKCTKDDVCAQGICAGQPVICDDVNPCTTDGCSPETGCTVAPVDDEIPCGENRWCQAGNCVDMPPQTLTFSTLNYNGMSGYPLALDGTIYCNETSDQEVMDALCQLAGYTTATAWTYQTLSINTCYCRCNDLEWWSPCCSGQQTQKMVTEVTCAK